MLRVKRTEKPIFMLVGNQCDKIHEREVTKQEGADKAKAFGCPFLETSAKTATNVERIFTDLVRSLRLTKPAEGGEASQSKEGSSRGGSSGRKEKKGNKCVIC